MTGGFRVELRAMGDRDLYAVYDADGVLVAAFVSELDARAFIEARLAGRV